MILIFLEMMKLKKMQKKIDNILKNIKFCDPAVGSGAFIFHLLI